MGKYVCDICGYIYDPEVGDPDNGVAPGTAWAVRSRKSATSPPSNTSCRLSRGTGWA